MILRFLDRHLHPDLIGNRPGKSTATVWWKIAETIESKLLQGEGYSGLVTDVCKAFNNLPRPFVYAVGRHLGIPEHFMQSWHLTISQIERRFVAQGAVSSPLRSATGYPEGDPLSVLAMALLNEGVRRYVEASVDNASAPIKIISYVDNWEIHSACPEVVRAAERKFHDFAGQTGIALDQPKTFYWSLQAKGRKQLKNQGRNVVYATRDLGGHLQHCRRLTNATVQTRIAKHKPFWGRLRCNVAPPQQKLKAIMTIAWPRCFYGIRVVALRQQRYKTLRAAAMQSMRWDVKGASSLVQFGLVEGGNRDPGFFALQQVVRAFITEQDSYAILDIQTTDPPKGHVPGPCGVFLGWLHTLSWRWRGDGYLEDHEGFIIHLVDSPIQWLYIRLKHAWGRRIGSLMQNRQGFEGLGWVDDRATRCGLTGWQGDKLGLLRVVLNGSFYTRDKQHHNENIPTSQCPWCHETDGIQHRHWECPFFADVINEVPNDVREIVHQLPACTKNHGWVTESKEDHDFRQALLAIPDTRQVFETHPDVGVLHLFTDGNCLHPTHPNLRLATWAFVQADLATGLFHTVASGGVHGQYHTTLRAELCAVVSAIRYALALMQEFVLWVDNQLVVDRIKSFASQNANQVGVFDNDHDLWQELRYLLYQTCERSLFIQVTKVTSHQDVDRLEGIIDRWAAKGNHAADRAAEIAQQGLPGRVTRTHARYVEVFLQRIHIRDTLMKHFVKIGEKAVAHKQRCDTEAPQVPVHPPGQPEQQPMFYPVPDAIDLSDKHPASAFASVVLEWFRRLQAPQDCTNLWLSSYQLYIHFQGVMGLMGMMFHQATNRWVDAAPFFDMEGFQFLRGAAWFVAYVKCLANAHGSPCAVRRCIPYGDFLRSWTGCILVRASPGDMAKVDEILRQRDAFAVKSVRKSLGSLEDFKFQLQ